MTCSHDGMAGFLLITNYCLGASLFISRGVNINLIWLLENIDVGCFYYFLITEILIKNFENGAHLITILKILSVIVSFISREIFFFCSITCIWAYKSGSEGRMCIWKKELHYIWVATREKIDDNMGTKVP